MSKHTPGPWVHHAEDNIITTNGGKLILEWTARSNHILSGGMSVAERDANARLISAAPELLEALILMVRTHDEPAESLLQEMREQKWLEQARAAIAKATGEQA